MSDKNNSIITSIILKYLENTASPEDIKELQAWVSLSAENERRFQEMRNIWEMTEPGISRMNINVESALLKVKSKAGIPLKQTSTRQLKFVTYFQRVAAILILPALITITVLMIKNEVRQPNLTCNKVVSPYGLVSEITLPDGSKVWLNAGSTLKYPVVFTDKNRNVEMSGEAYFEVQTDKTHPFVVQSNHLKVTATGTAFNVCSYAKSKEEVITLVSGKVAVSQGDFVERLLPGQQLSYQRESKEMKISDIDTFQFVSWKDGIMAFRDDPLEFVFNRLEQIYRVRFVIKDPSVRKYTYRATFKGETLDEILTYIELSIPVTFHKVTPARDEDNVDLSVIEVEEN